MHAKENEMTGNLPSKIARNGPSKAEQDQGVGFQGTDEEVVDKIFELLKTNKPQPINNASEYLYKRTALITQSQDSGQESEVPDTDAAQQKSKAHQTPDSRSSRASAVRRAGAYQETA
jgi:hypothetical protein